uniref:Uncharacterized protein n=1 Tax=Setaria digitata TaxID=48799 RepID=D2KKK3_9BILA|nr:hypothetical protein [Setaria digitata]
MNVKTRKRFNEDSIIDDAKSCGTVLLNSDAVASTNSNSTNENEYDVWLVRKPTRVPLSDLLSIKFPHKAKNRIRLATPSRSDAVPLYCHFSQLAIPHVYIPTTGIRTQKDAMALKATNLIKGVVVVSEKIDLLDNAVISINDDTAIKKEFGPALGNGTCEINFKIKPIRKKPHLPTDDVKQRLKPFGIIPKKKKKSYRLPNLINY